MPPLMPENESQKARCVLNVEGLPLGSLADFLSGLNEFILSFAEGAALESGNRFSEDLDDWIDARRRDYRRNRDIDPWDLPARPRILQLEVTAVTQGSIILDLMGYITPLYAVLIAHPVGANLLSSAIWEFGKEAIRIGGMVISSVSTSMASIPEKDLVPSIDRPPVLTPESRAVKKAIKAIASAPNGGSIKLVTQEGSLEIVINPSAKGR